MLDNILLVLVSFVMAALLGQRIIPGILVVAHHKNLFDLPDERKVHDRPIPRLGGVTFFPVIVFVMSVIGLLLYTYLPMKSTFFHAGSIPEFFGLLAGLTLLYVIGIGDDLIGVRYSRKFLIQIMSALMIPLSELYINHFYGLFGLYEIPMFLGVPLTLLLTVFITNAINLIDGIDGLASGLCLVALGMLGFTFALEGLWMYTLLAFISVGVIIPFFCYNVYGNVEKGQKIFTDSFRASNVRDKDGGGIGLMITRQIVLSHEGEIFFSSVEGKGTTFTVSFPFSYRHADIIQQEDNIGILRDNICRNDEMKIRSTILIVDDEPDMLTYLTDILSGEYDVLTAGNAAAALEMARQSNPDLIITDVVMPVMNGEELCRILKSNFETIHIPIILLSAANARQSIIFGLEAGANDYMTKPFDPSVLKARIRNLLMDRQRLRETLMTLDRSGDTPEPEWPSRMDKEFMDKVIAILERELSNQEFKIGDLCLEIAMSRTALYNKLKSLTGQGPNDFIRIFRLTRAKELLREKKHSIAEISDMVGFSDPKYFSVCFKKQFGESPSRI